MSIIEATIEKAKQQQGRPAHIEARPRRPTVLESRPSPQVPLTFFEPSRRLCLKHHVLLPALRSGCYDHADSAYRILRTRLLHRLAKHNWSIVGVASAAPGDGKTLTALNLALSIAREAGATPILIDLDMRNPNMCRMLGVWPKFTLVDYFEGNAEANSVFFTIGVENLVLAGSERGTDHSSELLGTRRLPELIDYARTLAPNPIVLLDLPPVLSTDEAFIVAPHADALLMVVSEGVTPRPSFQQARNLLAEFPMAGFVLNRSREGARNYHYGYPYK